MTKGTVQEHVKPSERLFNLLVKEDDITWKDIIFDLIKTEQMDPWDIDVGQLSSDYLVIVKKMKELDLKVGAKVILAAAILLKVKSKRLVGSDMDEFDRLLAQKDVDEVEDFYEELEGQMRSSEDIPDFEKMKLIPRMPQPRHRKVSIYDLVGALEQALEVKRRRILRQNPELKVEIPKKKYDITLLIKRVYYSVMNFFTKNAGGRLTFTRLLEQEGDPVNKEKKVLNFIPLLYLSNQQKIQLKQDVPFGEIDITPLKQKKPEKAET